MKIIYRDTLGIVVVKLDNFGVSFIDGKACFDDENGKHYSVAMESLIEISIF